MTFRDKLKIDVRNLLKAQHRGGLAISAILAKIENAPTDEAAIEIAGKHGYTMERGNG